MNRTLTKQDIADIGRCQRMLPTERDFIGRPGYERTYREGGGYDWSFKYRPNVDGKLTKTGGEVQERMMPFIRSDAVRHADLEARVARERVRDSRGSVRLLEPGLAESAARRNGWSHVWRAGGVLVESGLDGMLFRCVGGAWEPLGVRCLGTPLRGSARVPRRGVQRDPDGWPWRWIAGAWRKVV